MKTPITPRANAPTLADTPVLDNARTRAVHRCIAEARRGVPVVLATRAPLIVVPAETVGAEGLRLVDRLGVGPARLLLAPSRAAAILGQDLPDTEQVVALALAQPLIDVDTLRRAADPTLEQILPHFERVAPPAASVAALALGKLARLLPAMIVAPVQPGWAGRPDGAGLLAVPAADLLAYPTELAATLTRVAEVQIPLEDAPDARLVAFRALDQGIEHMAILVGDPAAQPNPLVRIHSECFTGDLLGSLRCDCGPQLKYAIRRMSAEGGGALLYLAQEGRGIGLINKLRAYKLQDRGLDTLDANRALGWQADERNFHIAASMLRSLGLDQIRLLTNNPDKIAGLEACGIVVAARVPHIMQSNGVNDGYLDTKQKRFGHLMG
ncbi:MAG TPA: GTP cyclohydrolase II [Acidiphilium sp.]|nr:MAG: GTP cyclohydrolase II [Acidiphilium sp. 21-60-14]OYV89764.1 MAG: GTP cyclohydrolase II [Acidiphilium sp. 37-60-79]OZB39557.1 MAG: GTP cyclohydrolase II [Acidiphilium sp. 34-60-192]HQT89476.1 GTP cyclohydrolase II [Acidiphilium sp.]HQU24759.1 GTP cyclohydrolase II [Acidiphilium sp.]